jgi:hypothetical protein
VTREEEIKTVIADRLEHFGYQLCTLHKAEQVDWPRYLTQSNMSVPTRIINSGFRYARGADMLVPILERIVSQVF